MVVVPNDQLSLAIGRQGQNVRLASKLINWRIDVKSEQRYNNLQDPGYQSLLALKGVDESLADQLLGKGVTSAAVLAKKDIADLMVIRAIDEDFAKSLILEAQEKDAGSSEEISAQTSDTVISETVNEEHADGLESDGDARDVVVTPPEGEK